MSEKIIVFAGCFDGVNIEHRRVIEEAMRENRDADRFVAVIFPEVNSLRQNGFIYSAREKEYALKKLGVDEVVFANEEIETVLNIRHPGCTVEKIIYSDNENTESLLNKAFDAEDYEKILELLGGEYYVIGPVVAGRGEGHRHGMPTANIKMEDGKRFLPFGVYGGTAAVCGKKDVVFGGDVATCGGNIGPGREYKALTNIGPRPSADSNPAPTVESLLVDFDEDIYGEEVVLCITDFIRRIMHFEGGLDEVRLQIARDKEALFK